MPNGTPAQLANLNPPYEPGHSPVRYSKAVIKALSHCRKLMPEMVETAVGIVRDESMPPNVRVKCIELIMERGMPKNPNAASAQFALGQGNVLVRLELIDPATQAHDAITISLNGHGDG